MSTRLEPRNMVYRWLMVVARSRAMYVHIGAAILAELTHTDSIAELSTTSGTGSRGFTPVGRWSVALAYCMMRNSS